MPGWEVISWALVVALPVSLPAAVLLMPNHPGEIALKPWLALFYVALFSQWIGFFAWNAGMAIGGIARLCWRGNAAIAERRSEGGPTVSLGHFHSRRTVGARLGCTLKDVAFSPSIREAPSVEGRSRSHVGEN